ncbi:glutamate 5-kinase [Suttonella sp. R2A3]|uniref:glutamate 5-kinase n=1 Tax=Suttonella sp. R2A3 TaxID=2908648 RepID=UPI0038FD033A
MPTFERAILADCERWVIKIGSAMLTGGGADIDAEALRDWTAQMAALQQAGKQIVVVSSGAIAVGMHQLGWTERPTELSALQTAAAVGQMRLSHAWQEAFAAHGITVAQVLLTHDDAADRKRYLNIRSSLQAMCRLGIVPVVNENDTVSYEEIRFGDNDNLGAMVANITGAGAYLMLTDQQGMYDKHPGEHADAKLIEQAAANDPALLSMAGKRGGALGSGGMYTKVLAAQKAAHSGTHSLLAHGREPRVIERLAHGESIGTCFVAPANPQQARKQWLGSQLQVQGTLCLDDGAVSALRRGGKSLLAVGVRSVRGDFARGALVECVDQEGHAVARGLINYNAEDASALLGKHSHELSDKLVHGQALIHRDNLVVL